MIKRVNEEGGKGSHENCLRLQQKIARKRGEIATKIPENVTKRAENVRTMTAVCDKNHPPLELQSMPLANKSVSRSIS